MAEPVKQVPMQVFHGEVRRTESLSAGLTRVVLHVPGYASTGVGDEYLRLLFPGEGERVPRLPDVVDGNLDYGSIDLDRLRTYTARAWDAGAEELTIDFVLHDRGIATTWAQRAVPGDVVGLNSPTGMHDPPDDLAWLILVTDLAGLPAAARILEQTPPGVAVRLVVEVADESHRVELPSHPRAEVTWLSGGNGHGPSRIEEVVRSLPRPDGVGYTWVAGESRVLRGVRKHLRHELGLPATAYKTVGYWVQAQEEWSERYDALPDDVRAEIDSLWDSDRDPEEIEDEYHDRLTRLGL